MRAVSILYDIHTYVFGSHYFMKLDPDATFVWEEQRHSDCTDGAGNVLPTDQLHRY